MLGWTKGFVLAGLVTCAAFSAGQAEYPGALWNPAYSGNYSVSNRPSSYPITHVVIHIMEGYYAGSISWFQNPLSQVSAHYCLRSSDGEVTQMVLEKDRAWHAGVTFYNNQAVGIEHEGFSSNPSFWYTDVQYASSARLTRYLCAKYNIAKDRTHIIGHKETGRATSCPGPWDWTKYMAMVQNDSTFFGSSVPSGIAPGSTVTFTVQFTNGGSDNWTATGTDPCYISTLSPSQFYISGNWLSSTLIGGVTGTVAPGAIGAFTFSMKMPTTPGTYTENFQLYRGSIFRFGQVVPISFTVGQAEKIVDNSDAGFSTVGTWSSGNAAVGKYGSDYRFKTVATKTADYAQWNLNVASGGAYDVYAWWSEGTNRNSAVTYEISDRREPKLVKVDQRTNGGKWNYLGRVMIREGQGTVKMQGYGSGGGVAIADAVRVVGPY
ncbi:MAG: N-acetylmuramoyl-L-alanine amidase [Armatimonadetes bacterium]|nr:N-acetylmuramoyl-L-alanine amidase [Armatimonadota bacterium]